MATVEIWTADGRTHAVEASGDDTLFFEDQVFESSNVQRTRVTED
jgi:hypothetical protein